MRQRVCLRTKINGRKKVPGLNQWSAVVMGGLSDQIWSFAIRAVPNVSEKLSSERDALAASRAT